MTKLFSMKSAAFAGAAAFALALAAAPQADAAEASVPALSGTLDKLSVITQDEFTETEDGKVIYYAVAKETKTIQDKNFTAIANENLSDEQGNPYYNLSKYAGKENVLYVSLDGKASSATKAAISAAPKLKAKYDAKDGLQLTIGTTEVKGTDIVSGDAIDALDLGVQLPSDVDMVVAKADNKYYVVTGVSPEIIKSSSVLGTTLEVQAEEIGGFLTSPSKVAKLKIAAKPKAPKVSLKMNATKAFTWKISNKQEYLIKVNGKKTDWTDGSNSKDNWASIFSKVEGVDTIVSGDAITADVEISVRTKADKKAASAITVVKLDKSVASPTESAVKVNITKATYKANGNVQKATSASIEAVKDIQYSVEAGKWKKLGAGKTAKLKDTQKNVLVRIAGDTNVLPSLNTHVDIDFQTGKATVTGFDYDEGGAGSIVVVSDDVKEYTAQ